jgi:hypothetical protein
MAKKQKQQLDILWDSPEAFKLAIQVTLDGEKIAAENNRIINDTAESDKRQEQLV